MRIAVVAAVIATIGGPSFAAPTKTNRPPAKVSVPPKARPAVPPAPYQIPSTGTLNARDLLAIAKLASRGAEDQFSDDLALQYVGREFSITLGPDDLSEEYDRATRRLQVSTYQYSDGWELDRRVSRTQYEGQNSYGAKAVVTKSRGDIWGIEIPGSTFTRKPYVYSSELDGPAARDLSQAIRLRLTGTIKKAEGTWAEKNSILSKRAVMADATVSNPVDVFLYKWLVAVDISKAEWLDSRTGELLRAD